MVSCSILTSSIIGILVFFRIPVDLWLLYEDKIGVKLNQICAIVKNCTFLMKGFELNLMLLLFF